MLIRIKNNIEEQKNFVLAHEDLHIFLILFFKMYVNTLVSL